MTTNESLAHQPHGILTIFTGHVYPALMPIVRRVQKLGNSAAILLTSDLLAQLGANQGDEVTLEFVGDTMLVRRTGAPPPDALKVLVGVTALENPVKAANGRSISDGRQRVLLCLRAYGPSMPTEIAARLAIDGKAAQRFLMALKADGFVRRIEGGYELDEAALLP